MFPNGICIRTASPLGERDDVPRRILIDKDLMRDVAVETPHIGPYAAREAESFFFRAGLEPGVPNDGDNPLSPSFVPQASAYCFRAYVISSIFISFPPW